MNTIRALRAEWRRFNAHLAALDPPDNPGRIDWDKVHQIVIRVGLFGAAITLATYALMR